MINHIFVVAVIKIWKITTLPLLYRLNWLIILFDSIRNQDIRNRDNMR